MFKATYPTGVLETKSRNGETLEQLMVNMYRDEAEVLRARVAYLETERVRLTTKLFAVGAE